MAEEVVRVVYQLGGIRDAQQGAEALAGSLDHGERAARGASSAFNSLTSTLTGYLGFRALAGDARMASSALIGLSSDAEDTRIAIAGMLQAGGAAGLSGSAADFASYMAISGEVMAKIRKDARDLPGEAEDLMNVFRGAIQGGLGAGKSVMDIEGLSARMMAVAKVLQIPSEVAGRELQMMMEGRAGAHNALWQRLKANIGVSAEEFNEFSAEEKWNRVDKALKGYDPAIKEFGKTWSAVSSTVVDYAKNIARIGGEPIFAELKKDLGEIANYYEQHQAQIDQMARTLGVDVANAVAASWGVAKDVIGWIIGHGPQIKTTLELIAMAKIGGMASGLLGGAMSGAGIGSAAGPLGTVAGLAVGAGAVALGESTFESMMRAQRAKAFREAYEPAAQRYGYLQNATDTLSTFARQGAAGELSEDARIMQEHVAKSVLEAAGSLRDVATVLGKDVTSEGAAKYLRGMNLDENTVASAAPRLAAMLYALQLADNAAAASGKGLAGKPTTSHVTNNHITNHNRFETRIDQADNPDRVYSDIKRAVRDAQLFPKESAVAQGGVIR